MRLISETHNRKVWKADGVFITGTDSSTACKYMVVDTVNGDIVLRTNSLRLALGCEVRSSHSVEVMIANDAKSYAEGLMNSNHDFSQRPMRAVQSEFNRMLRRENRDDLIISGRFTRRSALADAFISIAKKLDS